MNRYKLQAQSNARLRTILDTSFQPEFVYFTTPNPEQHPERLVLLLKRTNATFPERPWSTHYWNGTYLNSGNYDLTEEEGDKDFEYRSKRGY